MNKIGCNCNNEQNDLMGKKNVPFVLIVKKENGIQDTYMNNNRKIDLLTMKTHPCLNKI